MSSNIISNQPYNYPPYNPSFQQNSFNQFSQNPMIYGNQNPMMYGNQSPMMFSGGQSPNVQYFSEPSPSPLITELAREFLSQRADMQYQRQLLEPYRQYLQDPYLINNYL